MKEKAPMLGSLGPARPGTRVQALGFRAKGLGFRVFKKP